MTVVPLGTVDALPLSASATVWQPSRDWATIQRNLAEALHGMRARRGDIDVYWRYYDGDHEQVWLTEGLRKAFGARGGMNDLQDNYCSLVVNAPLSRLAVKGWRMRHPEPLPDLPPGVTPPPPTAVTAAASQWEDNDMELECDDAMRAALIAGVSYVLVWPRMDADGQRVTDPDSGLPAYDVVTKDARNVYVAHGAKFRSRKWACQVWLEQDRWRATLYYSDMDGKPAEVVRLHTPPAAKVSATFPQQSARFQLDDDDPGGPMPEEFNGRCPMVPFKLDRRGKSWLRDAIPGQDKANKLAANKMVTAEFLAFPQRYVLTDQDIPDNVLRYSPGKVLQLAAGGVVDDTTGTVTGRTQVGQFTAADLETYDKSHQREVEKLFTIKQLPKHLMVNPGTEPSGDAIKADEGPFVSFVQLCQRMFGASWQDVQQLMGNDVVPVWVDPNVHNEESQARAFSFYRNGDVPLGDALRRIGWDEEEIAAAVKAELAARVAAQAAADQRAQQAALMFDQGQSPDQAAQAGDTGGSSQQ